MSFVPESSFDMSRELVLWSAQSIALVAAALDRSGHLDWELVSHLREGAVEIGIRAPYEYAHVFDRLDGLLIGSHYAGPVEEDARADRLSPAEQLDLLVQLREGGDLTEEEFEAEKRRLLDR